MIQAASDAGNVDALVYFLFDLLYLDGEAIGPADARHLVEAEQMRGEHPAVAGDNAVLPRANGSSRPEAVARLV